MSTAETAIPASPPPEVGQPGPSWLDNLHPIYTMWEEVWRRNERRGRGGQYVLAELDRFDWEPKDSEHYKGRQQQAVYLNFPDAFATAQVGHLQREAPGADGALDFGTLGEVRRRGSAQGLPTRAELVYYNATGTGNDGSGWDAFWLAAAKRAHHTGHRWILVESAQERPGDFRDEMNGRRPYLVEYSPLSVTDWQFEAGSLQYAIIRIPVRRPTVVSGSVNGTAQDRGYLVLVRRGWDGFGEGWNAGGWWLFSPDRTLQRSGDFASTDGQIPLFPLYYERDAGLDDTPAMSRPGTTEIGAAAIAYMNLAAAADFDAKDAASSVTLINGIDPDQARKVSEQKASGSRIIFIPPPIGAQFAATGNTQPTVTDASSGAVVADVFDKRLAQKRQEVQEIAAREASSTPDSSGASKQAGFGEQKAPRLALLAGNLEDAQNTAIYFLERRWGSASPTGSVVWPRDFDLDDVLTSIEKHFELQALAGASSPTLTAKLLARAAKENGLETDDTELAKVQAEYLASAQEAEAVRSQSAAVDRQLNALMGGSGGEAGGGGAGGTGAQGQ